MKKRCPSITIPQQLRYKNVLCAYKENSREAITHTLQRILYLLDAYIIMVNYEIKLK